mmetsp:Transcript_16914/g.39384  ORF Transcript_16914/g.39384 Transcript_16914/m.39384 type:complete len:236 (+) Transcript_16914:51-758(+)
MVIPIPGGDVQLQGPPPQELALQFAWIKRSVFILIIAVILRVVSGSLLFGLQVIFNSMNLVLNTCMGIWLLREDPEIRHIYNYLTTTPLCEPCGRQCPSEMACLLPFVLFNFVTLALDILIGPTLVVIIRLVPLVLDPKTWKHVLFAGTLTMYVISVAVATVGQVIGTYYGWQAYKVARENYVDDGGYAPLPGNAGPEAAPGQQRMGSWGQPAPSRAQAKAAFKPFSGEGRRLGD